MKWISLAFALLVLNSALSFHNVWPTPWITLWPEISVEAFVLILVLGVYRAFAGSVSRSALAALTTVLVFLTFGRYLEVTAPALYGRAINLYWDARYVPDVAAMLADALSPIAVAGIVVGALALLAGIGILLYWAVGRVAAALGNARSSGYLTPAAACVVVTYLLGYYQVLPTLRAFSIPVSQTYARQLGFVVDAIGGRALAALPASSPLDGARVEPLGGRDVIVTFVESYGATAFDEPGVAATTAASREDMGRAVEETGRHVVSAFVESTTFGGGSWLAHISLMTGIRVDENSTYNALLTQNRTTLPKLFRRAGYRAVAVMPGLKNQWPEGSFYGFDEIYGEAALDYRGPEFGWWRIPDQFTLARLRTLELDLASRPPVFVFFPTISTHAPFRPTPPYQSDWQKLLGAEPFPADALAQASDEPQGFAEFRAAYADALVYTYRYWAGYLRNHVDDEAVYVILGDHQPPATVSGQGVRWDVPVHVVTRDAALADRLRAHGFRSGMTPEPAPIGVIDELGPMLIR
jgi:hypothetical protein